MHTGLPRHTPDRKSGTPIVAHSRDHLLEPSGSTSANRHDYPRRHRSDEIDDIIVVGRERALAGELARNDPQKRRRDRRVVRPSPRQRPIRMLDEIGERSVTNLELRRERPAVAEAIGMPDTRVLHDDTERARPLHRAPNALLDGTAQDDADLKLVVGMKRLPSTGTVCGGYE